MPSKQRTYANFGEYLLSVKGMGLYYKKRKEQFHT